MSPPSSVLKNKPHKKPARNSERASACYLLHAGFLLGFFFDLEDGGDMFLRIVVVFQRTTPKTEFFSYQYSLK
jgi:hypothetical protein